MSKYIIDGQWKYKSTFEKSKRADFLRALTDMEITAQSMAEDLAHLEYNEDEARKKHAISIIHDLRIGLDLLEKNL